MVEILLNDLMFADDICVFWTSVRGLQGTLDVCQAYAESPLNYSQLQKDYLYDIKAKNTRSTRPSRCWHYDVWRVKYVSHYKYLGIILDIELSVDKNIQKQLWYQYYAANKLRASFSRFERSEKCTFSFLLYVPCIHHNYSVIQEDIHPQTACGL